MTVTVMALGTLNEENTEAYATFLDLTDKMIQASGGRVVARYKVAQPIVGETNLQTVTLTEYPDRAALDRLVRSNEFSGIQPIRNQAFRDYQFTVLE